MYTASAMNWSGEWWIGVLGGGLLLLIGTTVYAKRLRSLRIRSAALRLGFSLFNGSNPFSKEDRKASNLFSRGYGGKMRNTIADRLDLPSVFLFDFCYKFGLPIIANVRYTQTVAAFSARLTGIPDLQMTPASTLDRAAPKLGFQAIHFDMDPDFGKKYWLRAKDETAVRLFFNKSFLDRLKILDPTAKWSVEKTGRWLIVYRHNALFAPEALSGFLAYAQALAHLFLDAH
jgi:hypothetical protein